MVLHLERKHLLEAPKTHKKTIQQPPISKFFQVCIFQRKIRECSPCFCDESNSTAAFDNQYWFKKKPTIEMLRVFGCLAYYKEEEKGKLSPQTQRGLMLGNDDSLTSYCIMNLETHTEYASIYHVLTL